MVIARKSGQKLQWALVKMVLLYIVVPEGSIISVMSYSKDGMPFVDNTTKQTSEPYSGVGYNLYGNTYFVRLDVCGNWAIVTFPSLFTNNLNFFGTQETPFMSAYVHSTPFFGSSFYGDSWSDTSEKTTIVNLFLPCEKCYTEIIHPPIIIPPDVTAPIPLGATGNFLISAMVLTLVYKKFFARYKSM